MATRPDGSKAAALLGVRRIGRRGGRCGFGRVAVGSSPSIDAWLFPAGPDWGTVTPAEFDHAQTGVVLTGTGFEASQGAGLVELGDASDYTTATKATQTVTAWAATSITITGNLGTLTPGPMWLFVTNNTGQHSEGRPVVVHRAAAFTDSATANISAAGADTTTARLTAPSGKTTGDHDPGRRVDDSATTPSTTTTANDYTEHEFALEATAAAVAAETYEFRIVYPDGTPLGTYTVTPEWTIDTGGATIAVGQASETDTAQPVALTAGAITIAVAQASETDTAQPVTRLAGALTITVGLASEADTAQAVTLNAGPGGPQTLTVGIAVETDTALVVVVIGGLRLPVTPTV